MIINLVGGIPTPLKNMTSSVGMMKFPTEWNVIKLYSQLLGRGPGYCISDPKTRVFLGVTWGFPEIFLSDHRPFACFGGKGLL